MSSFIHQPNLTEGLSLIGWRLKRDAEIQARQNEVNFECEVEPSSTSYAAFEYTSSTDDNYDPYSNQNLDLCLEVDSINLNSSSSSSNDYDPYEVFMRIHNHSLLSSQSTLINNYRHYNFADDDTPIKYPLAIGFINQHFKSRSNNNNKRVRFRSTFDGDDDIAPTVTEMDMLEDDDNEEDNQLITKSYQSRAKRLNNDEQDQQRKRYRFDDYNRIPTRRGRPPSSQEDSSRKYSRIISQFEEQHDLKLGDIRVYTPKLRLRISSVNVNWINLPSIPNFPNKVHQS